MTRLHNQMMKERHLEKALEKRAWSTRKVDGLTLNFSPLLDSEKGLVHAFTTRLGGESPEPLGTFNLGRHIDCESMRADASANRKRLCAALGLTFDRLIVPSQVHSGNVALSEQEGSFAQVDGVATETIDRPLLLHFADCVPVMIYCSSPRALCIVHAGWKGTAHAIAKNGVKTLVDQFGCRPERMVAAVGPAIGSCCYPTGVEVIEQLSATVSRAEELIVYKNSQPHPDLKAINAMQLLESGVGEVDVIDLCTACNPDIFYSHRQSGGKTGRQGAIGGLV